MNTATLYTTSFHGIGPITTRELRDAVGPTAGDIQSYQVRDYDLTRFAFTGHLDDLLRLGTVEDLFFWITAVPLTGKQEDLNALSSAVLPNLIEPGLAQHRQVASRHGGKRTTFRVVVQAADARWRSYRRDRMQHAVEQGIARHYRRWKLLPDQADLEFWVQQAGKRAVIGLRLTDKTMRHRTYKTANIPGTLRPTIARALAFLSGIDPGDTFLDPMCGAGTILIERALAGRYRLLLGGDVRDEAVQCTLENFGNLHKPREIRRWDAAALPLDNASVDKVATNLPWGRQIGSPAENRTLYAGALREIARVLKPGGRAVFLTSEWNLLKETRKAVPGLALTEQHKDIAVLGRRADIFVLTKKDE